MKLGVFSTAGDKQTRQLVKALNAAHAGSAIFFDLSLDDPERSTVDAARLEWNGVDLATLDIAFLHGFPYLDPVIPSGDLELDWSVWREDYIALQMKYTYLYSLFAELERRGVKVVNSPRMHLCAFMKPLLLEQLRAAGLNVAASMTTNSMDAAKEFCARTPKVVWRPCTGRAAYQLFLDKQREALISTKKPPVLLAELKEGPLVRGYLYDGKPVLFLQRYVPDNKAEETLEQFFEVPCADVRDQIALASRTLGFPWFQLTFIPIDGKAYIYDVDVDPLWESLPTAWQRQLTALLAGKLLGAEAAYEAPLSVPIGPDAVKQRPTIFLRRMLQILFEFEQSKYS